MRILKWFPPQGRPRTFVLHKRVTTIGRALGNDIAVASDGISETHAQILFDGRDFNLEEVDKVGEILINGKKRRRGRLVHSDRVPLGNVDLSFSVFDEPPSSPDVTAAGTGSAQSHITHQQLAGLRKLYEFSEKLMTMMDIDQLLEAMLDAVIEVTGPEKGLILLNDDAFVTSDNPPDPTALPHPLPPAHTVNPTPASSP